MKKVDRDEFREHQMTAVIQTFYRAKQSARQRSKFKPVSLASLEDMKRARESEKERRATDLPDE